MLTIYPSNRLIADKLPTTKLVRQMALYVLIKSHLATLWGVRIAIWALVAVFLDGRSYCASRRCV